MNGLTIRPGDLLHGDRHGVQMIPLSIAASIPETVARMLATKRELIEFCSSPQFTMEALAERLERSPWRFDASARRTEF
jgi:regulator of RNase E activity RraA